MTKEYFDRHFKTLIGDGRTVVQRLVDGQLICQSGVRRRNVA
jgi:hypothetical protein